MRRPYKLRMPHRVAPLISIADLSRTLYSGGRQLGKTQRMRALLATKTSWAMAMPYDPTLKSYYQQWALSRFIDPSKSDKGPPHLYHYNAHEEVNLEVMSPERRSAFLNGDWSVFAEIWDREREELASGSKPE